MTDDTGGLLALSRSVLRRLACDPSIVRITTRGGLPIDIGRQTRQVSVALRRALQARDDTCRYPGCAATRQLHAHHVVHWADGGPTDHDPVGLQPPGWWGDRLDLDAAVAHLQHKIDRIPGLTHAAPPSVRCTSTVAGRRPDNSMPPTRPINPGTVCIDCDDAHAIGGQVRARVTAAAPRMTASAMAPTARVNAAV